MSIDDMSRPEDDFEANAAPYVLGALPDDECEAFVEHMESCTICREEVEALQAVAAALSGAPLQRGVPEELKSRVMATVYQEAGLRGDRARTRGVVGREPGRLSWRPVLALGAVAAAVVALAVIVLPSGGGSGRARVIHAQVTPANARATVRVQGAHAELMIAGMPQTSPHRVYEVWIKRGGAAEPTSALFTVTAGGTATVGVPGSVKGVHEVLVTSEPLGGSRVPTSAAVIVAHLS